MSLRQSVRRARRRSLVLALASVASLASGAVFAADSIDPRLQLALQRDLGISAKQVPQYLTTQSLSLRQGASAKRALGSTFAGSWIERKADGSFGFVVATSGTGKAARSLGGVEVRNVRHSLGQLETAFAALESQARSRVAGVSKPLDGVHSWRVDPATNSVVVSLAPGATGEGVDFVALSGADAGAVRFETDAGTPTLLSEVIGGDQYYWDVGEGYRPCSVGFSVTKGVVKGFVTAGHCGKPGLALLTGDTAAPVALGTVTASDHPGTDMAWVTVNSEHTLLGQVKNYSGGLLPVKGSVEAPVGAALCRSGRTTGYHCGTIRAKNVTVKVGFVDRINGLTETNVCTGPGDSGGSWITADGQAQGVTSTGLIPFGARTIAR
ncbi:MULTISPECIES: S1 family peptidase [unclassified Lysobacter]|uniref:S1 family peptidase n=1 Tax=unclassified Lysobacter TaxID=2635362 RepID=UPI001BE830C3|nr:MULTISPECIES: S1 family peptidase [unclassified Lysobacter]MBT2748236.1 S1 family peptidase [Lysobacter sp. ISL-42]MBT2753302.1 S1 family peptidase [Lysobacter sp. ISL-50]MBT2779027.1 S1 family peptidase [Lysobacter sp. ISL-54]MBT2784187.1 S1 family peptidase [Lysobacter sp. ISL-52]